MTDLRLLIATPSPVERSRLSRLLSEQSGVQVIGQAGDLSETYTLAESLEPDVVLLSESYAALAEFACMASLFTALKSRWLFLGATAGDRTAGATDPLVIRMETPIAQMVARIRQAHVARPAPVRLADAAAHLPHLRFRSDRVVVIGASTGGIDALLTVLTAFPEDCPPTAIVQHTGQGFSGSLVKLLDRRCAATVIAAEDGLAMQTGQICVAAGTVGHFRLTPGRTNLCRIMPGVPISGHVPSVDALFRSAVPFAERVVAVLLTGMGRDGAEGLLDLRRAGARTIGQDADSAVVYGMPRAAAELGAVERQVPLSRIGAEILRLCAQDGAPQRMKP